MRILNQKKHSLIFAAAIILMSGEVPANAGCETGRQSPSFSLGSVTASKCPDSPRFTTIALLQAVSAVTPTRKKPRRCRRPSIAGSACNAEPASLPKISLADATVVEGDRGNSSLVFTVSMDSFANGYVDVGYSTSDGTATSADGDYISAHGTLTIAPGFTSTEVIVSVTGDRINELDETLTLSLNKASANATLARAAATGTILTDELPGQSDLLLPKVPRGVISNGSRGKPIAQGILDNPHVTGIIVLNGWHEIETSEGMFNWDHIDSEVARAKAAGKVVRLAIHAGGDSAPNWIFQNYPAVKKIIWYDKITGAVEWIPAFWDPVYIEIKRRFYEAVGNRYKDSDTIFAMSAAMVDPNTGDWAFKVTDAAQEQSYLNAGFTEESFISAYKRLLDYAMAAFKNKYVVTAAGPIPKSLVSDKYYAANQVLDYAYATYGDRLIIIKGSLNAATPDPSVANGTQWETILKYAPNTAAQFVWSVTKDPEYKMNGKTPYSTKQIIDIFRSAVETGKGYGLRWIEPWSIDILNPALQNEVIYAADLISSD